ncbi:MAG TPA: Na/Pi cotransporter family protein, partial [Halanaerobiales bacterium]|nr:Na/Pi cotransporter family protein [Halanaerobiales bacterium]
LIAFNLNQYSLHAIAIGAAFYLFAKRDKYKQLGQVILGFGLLFLGLSTMTDTMKPLKDSVHFYNAMESLGRSPFLGIMLGTLITVVLQSSSASMGILMGLMAAGAINYWVAVPILLGENIGTTITAMLSSVGANRTAKRAAAAHFMFNFIGAGLVIILFYIIPNFADRIYNIVLKLSEFLGQAPSAERMLANTHTFFNILNTLLWLPFVGFMVNIVRKIIPGDEVTIKRGLNYLDERMLKTPALAIDQLKAEVLRMYDIAGEMVKESVRAFMDDNMDVVKYIQQKEDVINELEEELVKFLTRFPRRSMSEKDTSTVDMYYAMIDDIESIADDAQDIAELARYKFENRVNFSDEAEETLNNSFEKIFKLMQYAEQLIQNRRKLNLAQKIIEGEEEMDQFQLEHRNGHMERLGEGICDPNAGIVYLEVLDNLEHISDQLADITHSVLEAAAKK